MMYKLVVLEMMYKLVVLEMMYMLAVIGADMLIAIQSYMLSVVTPLNMHYPWPSNYYPMTMDSSPPYYGFN